MQLSRLMTTPPCRLRPVAPVSGTRARIPRVLVIDDEADFGDTLREALATEYEVVAVTEADEALRRLRAGERYDVILCDMMMPSMDGVEFHRQLMTFSPDNASRVVFMSGGALVVRVESFFDHVPNALLSKPVDLDGLRAFIERRLGGGALSSQAVRA